jgi:hypothetical protein
MSDPAPATVLTPGAATPAAQRLQHSGDSIWWLVLVAGLFSAFQLIFVAPRLGLSWDEVVYVSQVSSHAPAAYFDPARARGIPLLVAPVTLLTGSVLAMRIYLAIASGLALFVALLAWRGIRPTWVLALGGGAFASLWAAQYYGPQAMPDEWVAFAALAAAGFFLRAAGGDGELAPSGQGRQVPRPADHAPNQDAPGRETEGRENDGEQEQALSQELLPQEVQPQAPRGLVAARPRFAALAGLAGAVAVAALVRPGDAIFLTGAFVVAVLAIRAWRRWELVAAIAAGLIAGCAQWVIEAYVRFGGPLQRLHAAGAEQDGFGVHAGFWDEFRAVNGPTLCRPCTVGVRDPEISLWWLALPVLVVLGVLAARRFGRFRSSLLVSWSGFCVAFQYLFLINYAAPRFLLPAYALLVIPVADLVAWLLTSVRAEYRGITRFAVGFALITQILVQQVVLDHQIAEKVTFFGDYTRIASQLNGRGIRGPCLIEGEQDIPIAFYTGCASAGSVTAVRARDPAEPIAVLVYPRARPPAYARHWHEYRLHGIRTSLLKLVVYVHR